MSQESVGGKGSPEERASTDEDGAARTPRRRHRDRTHAAILRAAGDLFARRGYAHVTLQQIAQHVGVTPALIVHYFGSKRHLFAEVAQMPSTTALRFVSLDAKTVAGDLVTFWREDDSRLAALALLRSLDLDGGEKFRQETQDRIFGPWGAALSGEDAEIRARLLGGFLLGYGFFSAGALMDPDGKASKAADERTLIYLQRIIDACLTPASDEDPPGGG